MKWNIPNILTVFRLIAAAGVPVMFLYFARPWADWFALALFIGAAVTDWIDGYLARAWGQESHFGAAMDPIADKAMVVIALLVITGYSGMNPWLILPATVILFREVFVSGLREYLGDRSRLLKVTRLAKWKTTAQMVAIAVLFLGTGLDYLNGIHLRGMTAEAYARAVELGTADPVRTCFATGCAGAATVLGLGLIWIAAGLTIVTGFDYFRKALPYLEGAEMIDILYFAWVRERIGLPKERLETAAPDVTALVEELKAREPRYAAAFADTRALRVALDQELADFDAPLAGVREVAFFPPMTGG